MLLPSRNCIIAGQIEEIVREPSETSDSLQANLLREWLAYLPDHRDNRYGLVHREINSSIESKTAKSNSSI